MFNSVDQVLALAFNIEAEGIMNVLVKSLIGERVSEVMQAGQQADYGF